MLPRQAVAVPLLLLWLTSVVTAGRSALVEEVVMAAEDVVHMAWLNGPTFSDKLDRSPQWPKFGRPGHLFLLDGTAGHCLKEDASSGQVVTRYCATFVDGLQLRYDSNTGQLLDNAGRALCPSPDGSSISMAGLCAQDTAFAVNSDGAYVHSATGTCLAPATSAFGTQDINELVLSSDCASWVFRFWTDWAAPPGYEDGWQLGGAASASSSTPPRWSFSIGNPDCEQYRMTMSDASGVRASGLTARRSSDGAAFPHAISWIQHMAWPSGGGCRLYFFAEPLDSGEYVDVAEWNAFFVPGDRVTFSLAAHSAQCDPLREGYTGYKGPNWGQWYCQLSSPRLDENKHLAMWSGRAGIVLDADAVSGNFLPRLGAPSAPESSSSLTASMTPADHAVDALDDASLTFTLTVSDGGVSEDAVLSLRPALTPGPAQMGLVRSGWVMNHVIVTRLAWLGGDGGALATALDGVEFWLEVLFWGDRAVVELVWEEAAVSLGEGVTAVVAMQLEVSGNSAASSTQHVGVGVDAIRLVLGEGGLPVPSPDAPVSVSGSFGNLPAGVATRPELGDVLLMPPRELPRCGYAPGCDPMPIVDFTATNSDDGASSVLRLSVTRNFPTRGYAELPARNNPGAEITGISVVLLDEEDQPSGIPCQISKNWHAGSDAAYWAGYDGSWWTVNLVLRLPPGASFTGRLAISYQRYGGLPAFSHAQLSIVGYSDKWTWEESALGSGGENMCFDPLGAHARAAITDVRPNLFDSSWKENVGGGDWLVYFDEGGSYVYPRALDSAIRASGPCLSNATYGSISADDAIAATTQVSGGRTDDFVKMFVRLRYDVRRAFSFSRLAFFQMGADFYTAKGWQFPQFIIGDGDGNVQHNISTACSSRGAHGREYPGAPGGGNPGYPFRMPLPGEAAPWWVAMEPNTDPKYYGDTEADKPAMVVGDRGLVIREFSAVVNGIPVSTPSISMLCERLELSPPAGVTQLDEGDYVDMKLEILVPQRAHVELDIALANTGSATLQRLRDTESWERVRAQALGGKLHATVLPPVTGFVESHYPIRVCLDNALPPGQDPELLFRVDGSAIGFVPVVICGLPSAGLSKTAGLWLLKLEASGGQEWTRVDQSVRIDTDFYQVDYQPESRTWDRIYNVELFDDAHLLFFGTTPPPIQPPTTTPPPPTVTTTAPPSTPPATLPPTTTPPPTVTTTAPTPSPDPEIVTCLRSHGKLRVLWTESGERALCLDGSGQAVAGTLPLDCAGATKIVHVDDPAPALIASCMPTPSLLCPIDAGDLYISCREAGQEAKCRDQSGVVIGESLQCEGAVEVARIASPAPALEATCH